MIVCYSISNVTGYICFYGGYNQRYIGYSLHQAIKQFRIDNGLKNKHIDFRRI